MELTQRMVDQPSEGALRRALSAAPLTRFSQGLLSTGLVEDLQDGPFTLLAPTDEAFASMPWRFDDLLFETHLLEARFDLFEYLVVRGRVGAEGERSSYVTLNGERVRLGNRLAFGRFGAARVLRTIEAQNILVHVLEQCIYPWDPKLCLAEGPSRS